MAYDFTRRHFFFGSLLAGAIPSGGFGSTASLARLGYKSPNEKLNIAAIGAGGQAASDLTNCASENIVALCDVDEKQAARKFSQYDRAPKYKDFRKMLDKEKGIATAAQKAFGGQSSVTTTETMGDAFVAVFSGIATVAAAGPVITSVLNAGSYTPSLAPGSAAAAFGTNL